MLIFLLGLALRFYFCLSKDLSFDGFVFTRYIQSTDPTSIFWANYPPLFLIIAKAWTQLFGATDLAVDSFIFTLQGLSYFFVWNFFRKSNASFFIQIVAAIFPASLYASTSVSPSALLELEGAGVFWLLNSRDEKRLPEWRTLSRNITIFFVILCVLGTSYSSILLLISWSISFLTQSASKDSPQITDKLIRYLVPAALLVFGFLGLRWVGWKSLSWIKADNYSESLFASFKSLYAFSGYSWINLAIFTGLFFLSLQTKKVLTRNSSFFVMSFLLILLTNLLLGLKAEEPRFIIFWVPFFLLAIDELFQILKSPMMSSVFKFIVLGFFLQTTLWFALATRSGLEEALQQLTILKPDRVVTFGFHKFIEEKMNAVSRSGIETAPRETCQIALLWPTNSPSARTQIEAFKVNLQNVASEWRSRRPSLDPIEMRVFKVNSEEELCH